MKNIAVTILVFFFLQTYCLSQTTIPVRTDMLKGGYFGPAKTIVKLDPISGIPIGNVPFDRNFILRIYFIKKEDIPKKVYMISSFPISDKKSELLAFFEMTGDGASYDATDSNLKYFKFAIDVLVNPLLPNKNFSILLVNDQKDIQLQEYLNIFKLIYDNKEDDAKKNYKQYIKENGTPSTPLYRQLKSYYDQNSLDVIIKKFNGNLNAASTELLAKIKSVDHYSEPDGSQVKIFQNIVSAGTLSTEQYTVQTNASVRIVGEGGLIYAGLQKEFNVATPYVGINISLRPFDSDISLSTLVRNHQISFFQRFSVNLGLTLNSIAKTGYRSNLFGNDNIMTGIGFKFNHYVSLIGGGLIYNNNDPNPLLDKKTVGVAPYLGISINLKIKDALGESSKVFTYGK